MHAANVLHLLVASLLVLPLVMAAPTAPVPEGAQFAVGLHGVPRLAAGDHFAGGRVVTVDAALGLAVVAASDARAFEAQARGAHGVRYVERDPLQKLELFTPNDPRYVNQYGLGLIGAPAAWDTTLGVGATKLCIVDTGVRYTHEDLSARWAGGIDLVNGDSDPWDDRGHGTHVTGIAAATANNGKGVSGVSGATILHAKALDATGYGTWSNVAQGIRWCADQGATVISLSLGGTSGGSVLLDAVNYAWGKGAIITAAAGNDGPCSNCVRYPARYENAIAVGCVDSARNLCTFSSTGPEVDLAAPGSVIDATLYGSDTAYGKLSGTSMSTPFVAGAAALLRSAHPTLTNAQIRAALESHAQDLGAAGLDASFGRGLARVDAAMAALGAPGPAPAPAAPDLEASALVATPSAPALGASVALAATIRNVGTASAGSFVARFYVDGSAFADVAVSGLAAGATTTASARWTATSGAHTLKVVVDPTGAITESSEANNAAQTSVTTQAPPPTTATRGVTLTPDDASATVRSGKQVNYHLVVKNTGSATDTFTLSASNTTTSWRVTLGTTSVTLAAGQSATVDLYVRAPRGLASGTALIVDVRAVSQADASKTDSTRTTTTIA